MRAKLNRNIEGKGDKKEKKGGKSIVIVHFLFSEILISFRRDVLCDETQMTAASFQLYRILMARFYGNRCKLLPAVSITFPLCLVKSSRLRLVILRACVRARTLATSLTKTP